ncbi:MAG: hypothetical protein M3024_06215 [Candidatus Dormibacteraeota bacterium]|nr:hypothetical protein [Candidatus Dormibacteraeota bacterium]
MLEHVDAFLGEAAALPFLSRAGEPEPGAAVALGLSDATLGWWDGWRPSSLSLWRDRALTVQAAARARLGEAAVRAAFYRAAEVLEGRLWRGLRAYQEVHERADPGVAGQAVDAIERDLTLAALEAELGGSGFFSELLPWYRAGRWPCGRRDGHFPAGRYVVL